MTKVAATSAAKNRKEVISVHELVMRCDMGRPFEWEAVATVSSLTET